MTAAEATERLRAAEPPFSIAPDEAICPRCRLAFFVGERAFSWGICPDCAADLIPVPDN